MRPRVKAENLQDLGPDLPAGLGESLGEVAGWVAAADPRDTAISRRPFSHMDTGWAGTVVGSSLSLISAKTWPHPTAVRSQCWDTSGHTTYWVG